LQLQQIGSSMPGNDVDAKWLSSICSPQNGQSFFLFSISPQTEKLCDNFRGSHDF